MAAAAVAASSGGGGAGAGAGGGGYASLTVRELKDILEDRGVDISGVIERGELISLCEDGVTVSDAGFLDTLGKGIHKDVDQDISGKWGHMRRGTYGVKLGGSEVGAAVGLSAYAKPYSLWQKMVAEMDGTWDGYSDEQSAPQKHGNFCEPLIAGMYAKAEEKKLARGGYYPHPDQELCELYGASPDRRVLDADGNPDYLLEIKGPFGRFQRLIRPEYMAQIQMQLLCSGLERCDFVSVKLDPETPLKTAPREIKVYYAHVYRSDDYLKWLMPRLFFFSKCLILRKCPPRDLYDNEMMGYEPPPRPRIEEVDVEDGAWTITDPA